MKKKLTVATLLLFSSPYLVYQLVFDIPGQPTLVSATEQNWQESTHCYQNPDAQILDKDGKINLLVWNIYKQNRASWQKSLSRFSADAQLMLLQEASLTDSFKSWMVSENLDSQMVKAFDAFDTSAGVISLSHSFPAKACAYTSIEPWLRLPKSALYTRYPLSNGQQLAAINVHAINFTLGTEDYEKQLKQLQRVVDNHRGPLLLAGDFNSWSESRMKELSRVADSLGLAAVPFDPDNRKQFVTGLPLDHIYYKNLKLINAKAPESDASDHNPLLAGFELLE
ncbi:endonuclease/exonuclease/phosphatase family protein [Vibrio sp. JC009]|uniref:endonuclease/exonuclease/phosphatase family protein n=1 Tax=Vibrio sp. JC009 TaxID=2912314 RepID=UPI0023B0F3D6|nr:endonuclease/exonuclease/phosphatase family protein [Vibrio sp. JC009]WED21164.1 endonuclease/exonuclease/phosphatase family protein [Vibrio sp. JC009]